MGKARRSFCLSKHHHPSISEADYCNWLLARKQGGEILDYSLYPNVDLTVNGKLWRKWAVDFKVIEKDGGISYHECKGYNLSDQSFKLKLSAFRLEYPNIPIYVNKMLVTKDSWSRRDEKNYVKSGQAYLAKRKRLQKARREKSLSKSKPK